MKNIFLFTTFILFVSFSYSQKKAKKRILNSLSIQTESWNNGDIEGFMKTYWNNDSLMFIGKSGVTYGWNNTLNNYKKGYPDRSAMGKLDFTIISVKKLSRKYYSVTGKWHLTRTMGDLQGHFTLLFKKVHHKWMILQDHSS